MISTNCARWALREDSQRRISFFMHKAAIAVMAEAPETANHADRVVYAGKIFAGSASIYSYTLGVATNSTISAEIDADAVVTDNDIEFTVNSLFDAFAG